MVTHYLYMHKPAAVLTYVTAHHLPHFHTRFIIYLNSGYP